MGSAELKKSDATFFYYIKCMETFESDKEVCMKKLFKLQSICGKVLVSKYCKIKVQEEQLTTTPEARLKQ